MRTIVMPMALLLHSYYVHCHLSDNLIASNIIEESCILAQSCLHDTIPICGQMGENKKTFLDTCDLLEYVCDKGEVYNHIEDEMGCPVFKNPK